MKHTRKITTLVIVLAMLLTMTISASAASITITPPDVNGGTETGITYTAYKIMDATIDGDAFAYTISGTSTYFKVLQDSGLFTLTQIGTTDVYNAVKTDAYDDEADAKTLAASLKAATTDDGKTLSKNGTVYKATDLDNGFYLVTSSVGAALVLDTIGDLTITTKNVYPTLETAIVEVSADQGATVTVTLTVKVPADASGNIDVTDVLTGMEFKSCTPPANVTTTAAEGDTNVVFTISDAAKGSTVTISYTATFTAEDSASNSATLTDDTYTSAIKSDSITTNDIIINKYDGSDTTKATKVEGATFVLLNDKGKYYKMDSGVVTWVDSQAAATSIATDANGAATFANIANGSYKLEETAAPAGYNKLTGVVEVNDVTANVTVDIANNKGAELPSTGGMGTTIFYILGSLLAVGALVVLVTNKRMRAY